MVTWLNRVMSSPSKHMVPSESPQNKDSPGPAERNLWDGLSPRIRTNLRDQNQQHVNHIFSLQTRGSVWPAHAAGLAHRPDFPQWITGEDSKWYLPGLHQISRNFGIQQLITGDYNSQHGRHSPIPSLFSLLDLMVYVKFQFIINLSQWRRKNNLPLWTSFTKDLD